MGIDAPEHELVGRLDGAPIKVRELDARAGNPFEREGFRIYQARERGWRWLVERRALEREARAAGTDLLGHLRDTFATLPEPDDAELTTAAASVGLTGIGDPEDRAAARSVWRGQRWELLRSALVARAAEGMPHQRIQVDIFARTAFDPAEVIGRIDGQPITRAQLREMAADDEEQVRREYVHLLRLQFDQLVSERLRAREAERRKLTVDKLLAAEVAAQPPIKHAEVRAFLKAEPAYAADPRGAEKARDVIRRLRVDAAEKALDERLRAQAKVEFFPVDREPLRKQAATVMPVAPLRTPGSGGTPAVLYWGFGCPACKVGYPLFAALMKDGGRPIAVGDSFASFAGYRAALALRCADQQSPGSWTLLAHEMSQAYDRGTLAELDGMVQRVGRIDREGFRRCLEEDRFLVDIHENALQARRLGIPPGEPSLYVDGVTIWDLDRPERVQEQIAASTRR